MMGASDASPVRGSFGAILLAGGRAARLDGIDKPLLEVDGESLLDAAIAAVRDAGAGTVVGVGPDRGRGIIWAREDPPFGGPAAAVVTGVSALERAAAGSDLPDWTFVLACDQPHVRAAVRFLAEACALVPEDTEGLCVADAASRPQWLTGIYRTTVVRTAARALPDGGRDAPVRALMTDLAIATLPGAGDLSADIDTWDDAARFGARQR